jgi:hypothetical protein
MSVPHSLRAGTPQLFGGFRMVGRNDISDFFNETPHHVPQSGTRDAGCTVLFKARGQRRLCIPARQRDRKATPYDILIERRTCPWWQRHLGGLAPFADQMQPAIAVFIGADGAKRHLTR